MFGKKNVCAVPFELLKKSQTDFLRAICDGIRVSAVDITLPSLNQARENRGFYEHLRRLNEKCHREFGSAFYEPFSAMRLRTYFHNELGVAIPGERLSDDAMRRPLGQAAVALQDHNPLPDIDLAMPKALEERLAAIYGPANAALAELTGWDLAEYGYRLPQDRSHQSPDRKLAAVEGRAARQMAGSIPRKQER